MLFYYLLVGFIISSLFIIKMLYSVRKTIKVKQLTINEYFFLISIFGVSLFLYPIIIPIFYYLFYIYDL